jgi:hypothetical protein
VSAPDTEAIAACRAYTAIFAPALMLMLDRAHSPGLLVRPRPGRVELGGEYAVGAQLAAAFMFAVGSVSTCLDAVRDRSTVLPARIAARVEPAVERFGWYVDRAAFGTDLYAGGRGAILELVGGGQVAAGDHLEQCWRVARATVARQASPAELALVDDVVAGRLPIPLETPITETLPVNRHPGMTAHGDALRPRGRQGFALALVMLTWETAIFLIVDRSSRRRAFAAVAGTSLADFLSALDAGDLDARVDDHFRRWWRRSRLETWADVDRFGLFDEIGPRIGLLRPELDRAGRPVGDNCWQLSEDGRRMRWLATRLRTGPRRSTREVAHA